jgi:hypothetical protein
MKKLNAIRVALLSIAAFSAGTSSYAIDRGRLAAPGEYESVVRLTYWKISGGKEYRFTCTGTLLSSRIVVTAAHCIPEDRKISVQVSRMNGRQPQDAFERYVDSRFSSLALGVSELEKKYRDPMQNLKVLKREIFDARRVLSRHDLAFIVLPKPYEIRSGQTSSLACLALPGNTAVSIAGYGLVLDSNGANLNYGGRLYVGENRIETQTDAGLYDFRYEPKIAPDLQMTNIGDSGGPLFSLGNSDLVYGVSSTSSAGRIGVGGYGLSYISTFASVVSDEAKGFYRELIAKLSVDSEVKELVGKCL